MPRHDRVLQIVFESKDNLSSYCTRSLDYSTNKERRYLGKTYIPEYSKAVYLQRILYNLGVPVVLFASHVLQIPRQQCRHLETINAKSCQRVNLARTIRELESSKQHIRLGLPHTKRGLNLVAQPPRYLPGFFRCRQT